MYLLFNDGKGLDRDEAKAWDEERSRERSSTEDPSVHFHNTTFGIRTIKSEIIEVGNFAGLSVNQNHEEVQIHF